MKLNLYAEICCHVCYEVIHNHFDCPVCGEEFAPTSLYCDEADLEIGETISCEKCFAAWELVSRDSQGTEYVLLPDNQPIGDSRK